ncbi:DUF2637 domain-containing protein [Streptomyces sp. GC420]|uniref:DUF2637 domain-containing protein n=1 Tax=Streptomyces sp. GC420 TaxID=2697568 RepID=UPI001414F14A|nr:DUF2637 domain-containing protein [Streptomyces sp. GC420]NBM19434.1 DUF2637 domain-containing protein [Streptomyces sp. GC420]
MAAMKLTRTHRLLIGVVVTGAVIIAAIGFAGSYAAVRELAEQKGFGAFSLVFPIGIDAGICVLLALDLLLTWIRIPFPLLRQTAWLLTAATIAFNGAAAWPDPLGVGMHGVIPILFIVSVEAARHAVGRIADITADKHMEGVRLTRWLLSPVPTFLLWRRMKLWELRSYEQVIKLEQERLVYQARLRSRFGRAWRRKAPVESLMPLRLARYGVPLADTAPAGLAAAGIEPAVIPAQRADEFPAVGPQAQGHPQPRLQSQTQPQLQAQPHRHPDQQPQPALQHPKPQTVYEPVQHWPESELQKQVPATHHSPWFAAPKVSPAAYEGSYDPAAYPDPALDPALGAPAEPVLHDEQDRRADAQAQAQAQAVPAQEAYEEQLQAEEAYEQPVPGQDIPLPELSEAEFLSEAYGAFRTYVDQHGEYPNHETLDILLSDMHAVTHPRSKSLIRNYQDDFKKQYEIERESEHIA